MKQFFNFIRDVIGYSCKRVISSFSFSNFVNEECVREKEKVGARARTFELGQLEY